MTLTPKELDLLMNASALARAELRRCYSDDCIYAGLNQFKDCWARDSFFASHGALAVGDHEIVKKNLSLMASNISPEGQIPIRVGDYFVGLKVLGINTRQDRKPRYTQDKIFSSPTDQNSLFIIAAAEYLREARDKAFIASIYPQLMKAIAWNQAQATGPDRLMAEGHYATWADSITKGGKVLYTNVLHCQALSCLSNLSLALGKGNDSKYFALLSLEVKSSINRTFWNGKFYTDWIDKERHEIFSTDGNILSILYEIADLPKGQSIQACMKEFGLDNAVPGLTNHPKYPFSQVSIFEHLALMSDYHNEGMSWLWLGCLDALAKSRLGMDAQADDEFLRISEIIMRNGGVFEVYEQTGEPVRRKIYKAEHPFAWSSGLFLYVMRQLHPELMPR